MKTARIYLTPIKIIGTSVDAIKVRYTTNHGTAGPSGEFYVDRSIDESHIRDLKLQLRSQGFSNIELTDRRDS